MRRVISCARAQQPSNGYWNGICGCRRTLLKKVLASDRLTRGRAPRSIGHFELGLAACGSISFAARMALDEGSIAISYQCPFARGGAAELTRCLALLSDSKTSPSNDFILCTLVKPKATRPSW